MGGDLPQVVDLLFIGQWPPLMTDASTKRRPGTMTPVALFSGAQGRETISKIKKYLNLFFYLS